MTFEVRLSEEARAYIVALDEKSARIVKDNLRKLEDDPHPRPGSGQGDKEKLVVESEEMYRLHIGRTHTAFYVIRDDLQQVRVTDIVPIDEAHERYGF